MQQRKTVYKWWPPLNPFSLYRLIFLLVSSQIRFDILWYTSRLQQQDVWHCLHIPNSNMAANFPTVHSHIGFFDMRGVVGGPTWRQICWTCQIDFGQIIVPVRYGPVEKYPRNGADRTRIMTQEDDNEVSLFHSHGTNGKCEPVLQLLYKLLQHFSKYNVHPL